MINSIPVSYSIGPVLYFCHLSGSLLHHSQLGFVPFLFVLMRLWEYWWNLLKWEKKKEDFKKKRQKIEEWWYIAWLVFCTSVLFTLSWTPMTLTLAPEGFWSKQGADCLQFCISQYSHGSWLLHFLIITLTLLGIFQKHATIWLGGGSFFTLSGRNMTPFNFQYH